MKSFFHTPSLVLLCAALGWSTDPAHAAPSLVESGAYQYNQAITTASGSEEKLRLSSVDTGAPLTATPISFETGALTDGTATTVRTEVGWNAGTSVPSKVAVVFDLLRDYTIDRVEVVARDPNTYWGVQDMQLHERTASDPLFRSAGQQPWATGKTLVFSLKGRKARYFRLIMKRPHSGMHMPLSEVRFYTTDTLPTGSVALPGDLSAEFKRETLMVDKYGQFLWEDWPGKISSDAQLVADAAAEAQRLEQPASTSEALGSALGTPPQPRYQATGFFRLEKINQRWWLISPQGDPFFVIGVDGAMFKDGGYSTPVNNPDNTPRKVFQALPSSTTFPDAYASVNGVRAVSFLTANLRRKYGTGGTNEDYNGRWAQVMDKRLRAWGFNTHAKWTRDDRIAFPYITVLKPPANCPMCKLTTWGAVDPFDPAWGPTLESSLKGTLENLKVEPRIIGHTFENERGWDRSVVLAVLKLDSTRPAKREFITFMLERHGGSTSLVAQKLGLPATSTRTQLENTPVTTTSGLDADISAFIVRASAKYHEVVRRVLEQYDPNHLYLGGSLVPNWRSSPEWVEGSVPFVDALSFDVYQKSPSWIEPYLVHDKPILLLEFSFSTYGRGLTAHSPSTATPDQRSRGLHYRYYVEQLAARPQFIGCGFFLLYDQAVTHRSLPDGENFNMGLINQADQPYEAMIEEMKKTHQRVQAIHRGELAPVGTEILSGTTLSR
ncbi:hypothetical protein [Cystobacter ferrugineus]|uniref:Beta-agarase n=1 Tax=Cystobacter ferrugineus TaxID=83449 RepID=A0A1L9B7A1_9BACT|nr:hypothetical protein [Cystobacter ferrugineus]OJH38127.1 hypothetical protein BON30_23515 [Cystobacter ferrugineus]